MDLFNQLTGFEWDAGNTHKNQKHRVTTAEAEQVFFNEPLLVVDDTRHSSFELRFHALGITSENRKLHVTFTIRSMKIRVISVRDMHKKERTIYDKKIV